MSAARIASINFECPDPVSLARFWADLLDGEVVVETPDFCAVKIDSIYLGTTRVDDYLPPTWPTPEAFDDLNTAEAQALRLGATKESQQPSPERSRVLRDPAGHPFCLRA